MWNMSVAYVTGFVLWYAFQRGWLKAWEALQERRGDTTSYAIGLGSFLMPAHGGENTCHGLS